DYFCSVWDGSLSVLF
nr:immunoglobulin light chain junction region [Macaca mulatta]MOX80767.1 immunoglobulin light chain junction region [Macaca mulatta]MOX82243.1 immunoglobulin light chain junction region [Macaca mulatta]MOX82768.1 immunoglobulin light chain junction region [Macaca mulatta]MOX83237.1 immunoglobulin light chain junction region [Macaca mulatta]